MVINKATSLIFLPLLFAVLTAGGRTNIYRFLESNNHADGVCQLMVERQGYRCEEHKVTTEDGYILSLQRIPTGRSGEGKTRRAKQPVLLQHGILRDAYIWLAMSPDESLGFILADNGFDVWLGNTRGTNYSRGHTSFGPNDLEFWDWSWDELAAYDLSAMFRYVYGQTGQKLHYVAHSLGTLTAFCAFSRHEFLSMVRSAAMLAPIAYLGQMPSPLGRAGADLFLAQAVYWLGIYEFAPGGEPVAKLLDDICRKIDCSDMESIVTGPNCCMMNSSNHLNSLQPTSAKNLIHLSQMVRRGTIAMYDYDNDEDNNKHYGQATPPAYNMTGIPNDLPLFLGHGGKDLLADVNDVRTLIGALSEHDPNKLVLHYVEDYAHLDFVFGVNAKQVVYNPLMAFLKDN